MQRFLFVFLPALHLKSFSKMQIFSLGGVTNTALVGAICTPKMNSSVTLSLYSINLLI